MSKIEDGGPAFPVHGGKGADIDDPRNRILGGGMTLWDWFAGQALAGMLTSPDYSNRPASLLAKWAYELSDAMLEERNRPNE
jgi:hypothetical protein